MTMVNSPLPVGLLSRMPRGRATSADPRARQKVRLMNNDPNVPIFDGHNDNLLRLEIAARRDKDLSFIEGCEGTHIDLPRARQGGFAGGLFAMFTPSRIGREGVSFNPSDPANFAAVEQPAALTFTTAMFARMRRIAKASDEIVIATDVAAIKTAMAKNQLVMVPHIEGAEAIDVGLDALEVLYAAGLRSLGPVWSRANAFGDGAPMAAQAEPEPGGPLTDAGRELVRACERLGVMVDLSHLTQQGFWDVAKIASRPLVASHSNAHAISPSARNLTDRQLAAIRESGGLVGLNFHVSFLRSDCKFSSETPLEVMVRHTDHLLEHLGEGGVALGSDFDGCMLPKEIGDVSGLPTLVQAYRDAGYGEELIGRICAGNWLAALDRAWS